MEKRERGFHIPEWRRILITSAALTLIYLTAPEHSSSQDSSYFVYAYNDVPLEATLQYHIERGNIPDEHCGNPDITGYAGLFEEQLNIPHGTSIGKTIFIKETHPESDGEIHELCVMDVVAEEHNDERNPNGIADVDWNTYHRIHPNIDLEVTFVDPRLTQPMNEPFVPHNPEENDELFYPETFQSDPGSQQ